MIFGKNSVDNSWCESTCQADCPTIVPITAEVATTVSTASSTAIWVFLVFIFFSQLVILWRLKFYAVCSSCSKSNTSLSSLDREEFFCNAPGVDGGNPGLSSKADLVEEDNPADLVSLASNEEQQVFNAFFHSDSYFMI